MMLDALATATAHGWALNAVVGIIHRHRLSI